MISQPAKHVEINRVKFDGVSCAGHVISSHAHDQALTCSSKELNTTIVDRHNRKSCVHCNHACIQASLLSCQTSFGADGLALATTSLPGTRQHSSESQPRLPRLVCLGQALMATGFWLSGEDLVGEGRRGRQTPATWQSPEPYQCMMHGKSWN